MQTSKELEQLACEPARFTYTDYVPPGFKRRVIGILERLGGRRKLEAAYWQQRHELVRSPWATTIFYLQVTVGCSIADMGQVPETGPLIVIANHPYGALDGVIAADLIHGRRDDLKVVANRVLTAIPAIRNQLISIDFSGTREATRANLIARQQAVEHVTQGGSLLLFPAGGVSTAKGMFGQVSDLPWPNFTAKIIQAAKAPVLPVYFPGANTGLFQFASQFSLTLRLGLLMRELSKRRGTTINIRIGPPIHAREMTTFQSPPELLAFLRKRLYALEPTLSSAD